MKKTDLLRMIVDLQERVAKLEKDNGYNKQYPWSTPSVPIFQPYIQTIADPCIDGNYHDYPNPWNGITSPPCKKCGKQAASWTITCDTSSKFCNLCRNIPCSCVTASNS